MPINNINYAYEIVEVDRDLMLQMLYCSRKAAIPPLWDQDMT